MSLLSRRLDVAASPYDAAAFGLDPIKIESADGRIECLPAQTPLASVALTISVSRREVVQDGR